MGAVVEDGDLIGAVGASNCLRTSAYRIARASALRAAAPAVAPTETRPRIRVPSMVKNRRLSLSIGEL